MCLLWARIDARVGTAARATSIIAGKAGENAAVLDLAGSGCETDFTLMNPHKYA
jgi:hypothetical protein